jgi:hypothetical protein
MNFGLKQGDPLQMEKMKLIQSNRSKQILCMGDYEEDVTHQMLSLLRFIEYEGELAILQ